MGIMYGLSHCVSVKDPNKDPVSGDMMKKRMYYNKDSIVIYHNLGF